MALLGLLVLLGLVLEDDDLLALAVLDHVGLNAGAGDGGLADLGEDVLCAALTSAIRLIETTVNDVLAVGAAVKVKEEKALISLKLPGDMGEENEAVCQALLAGLMVYLAQLAEEYPENLSVLDMEV